MAKVDRQAVHADAHPADRQDVFAASSPDADTTNPRSEPLAGEIGLDHLINEMQRSADDNHDASFRAKVRDLASALLPASSPANDDKENVGALIRALRAPRRRRPEIVALTATAFWLFFCALFIVQESGRLLAGQILRSEAIVIILAVSGFVFALFILIAVAIRSSDMQTSLRGLVALVAAAADGPGLDGAVSRDPDERSAQALVASEEALTRARHIQNSYREDLARFEKLFTSNEERLKGLIDSLSLERASVATNAEKLRASISGAHKNLSLDLDAASTNLGKLFNDTSNKISNDLAEKGSELVARLAQDATDHHARFIKEIEGTVFQSTERFADNSARFASLLQEKGNEIDERLAARLKEVFALLVQQADDVQKKGSARVEDTIGAISELLDKINGALSERADALNTMLASKVIDISRTFRDCTANLKQDIQTFGSVSSELTGATEKLGQNVLQRVDAIGSTINPPLLALVSKIEDYERKFSADLAANVSVLERHLSSHATQASAGTAKQLQAIDGLLREVGRLETKMTVVIGDVTAAVDAASRYRDEAVRASLASASPRTASAPPAVAAKAETPERYRSVEAPTYPVRPSIDEARSSRPTKAVRAEAPALPAPMVEPTLREARRPTPSSHRAATPEVIEREPVELAASVQATSLPSVQVASVQATRSQRTSVQETSAPAITTSDAGPAPSGAGAQSWLSELLARASVDDQPLPPTPPVEVGSSRKSETTISSAIGDAGRLVDDTQLAKAWNDYRERQRDSFDRIYTDEGTKVLKAIRRQLSLDSNFASSVTMYNEQFERLLLSVDDGSDDEDLLKFLTTDAGKTYTLLAHASGRLALPADEVMQS